MNIGIIGLGLIGGSLGLDLRSHNYRVLGVSRKAETCERAIVRGVVDDVSTSLTLMRDADVVFICTPLGVMRSTVEELIPHLKQETVLTDVGSVKGWVVDAISPLWCNFVGGHPMAGTTESGIEAALKGLFVGAPYVLTPTDSTPAHALQLVEEVIRPLQVKIYHCKPDDHDRAVAWISHLPVMVSASLIASCLGEADSTVLELAKALASSGFRDTSRVGGGNPELGVMMATYNKAALVRSLHAYQLQLKQIVAIVEGENWAELEATLKQNQEARPEFLK